MDPLVWWHHHKTSFPKLWTLARAVLSVPATSASSERERVLHSRESDNQKEKQIKPRSSRASYITQF
eukprot:scaffold181_cov216-Ochromonas_danica.AAC.4